MKCALNLHGYVSGESWLSLVTIMMIMIIWRLWWKICMINADFFLTAVVSSSKPDWKNSFPDVITLKSNTHWAEIWREKKFTPVSSSAQSTISSSRCNEHRPGTRAESQHLHFRGKLPFSFLNNEKSNFKLCLTLWSYLKNGFVWSLKPFLSENFELCLTFP